MGEAANFVRRCSGEALDFSPYECAEPYLTEVQFYHSMQTLFQRMGGEDAVHSETTSHLRALMNDVAERFWRAYGVEITDSRTVYALCEPTLSPSAEPVACLHGQGRGTMKKHRR